MSWPDQPRGPDGKWRKSNSLLTGAAVAFTMAYVPLGGAGTGGVSGTGETVSIESSVGPTMRAQLGKARRSATKGNRTAAWRRLNLKRIKHAVRRAARCVGNSHGDVQRFFLHTPCRSIDRMLIRLGDGQGNQIVVSIAWVEMRNTGAARSLRDQIDVHGTGDIVPLPGAIVGAGTLDWTGWNYDSKRAGRTVTIAEVEALRGNPHPEYLDGVAGVASRFPRS